MENNQQKGKLQNSRINIFNAITKTTTKAKTTAAMFAVED